MEAKKLLPLAVAVVSLAIAGPAVAFGAGSGDDTRPAVGTTAPVVDPQTENEQESGEQGDVENADLATGVEAADGMNAQGENNQEDEVSDNADGVDDRADANEADDAGEPADTESGD